MSWGDVDKSSGGGDFLKLEAGQATRLHVMLAPGEEPYSFRQFFNQQIQRGCVVPEDYTGKGAGWKHAVPVYDYSDGIIKVWIMGKTTAGDLRNMYELYQGLDRLDIQLTRKGTGLQTKYSLAPIGTSFDPALVANKEVPDMAGLLAVDDDARIASIVAGIDPDGDGHAKPQAYAPAPSVAMPPVAVVPPAGVPLPATGDAWGAPPPVGAPLPSPGLPVPAPAPFSGATAVMPPLATVTQSAPPPAVANGNSAPNARVALMQRAQAILAEVSPAKKTSALKAASKSTQRPDGKTILSQFSVAELEKLVSKIGA